MGKAELGETTIIDDLEKLEYFQRGQNSKAAEIVPDSGRCHKILLRTY